MTSFGAMHDRPAMFVRVEDEDGLVGWGEIWCNFPACGAEHRARLIATVFAPLLNGRRFDVPRSAYAELAAEQMREGHRAFKLKVGFGAERDGANLHALRSAIGDEYALMADANQAWALDEAITAAAKFEPFNLSWLEEPLRIDTPWLEWQQLATRCNVPLAAGENLAESMRSNRPW